MLHHPPPLAMNGILMPLDFPQDVYERTHSHLQRFHGHHEHDLFAGAWMGLSHRFKAAAEYDESFCRSVLKHGTGPEHEERHAQERQLFGFAANAVSVFEAFYFAMFAMGSLTGAPEFSLSKEAHERQVTPGSTVRAYKAAFPNDPTTTVLEAIRKDPSFIDIRDFRNVLAHRRVLPRHHALSVGGNIPPTTQIGAGHFGRRPLDANTTPTLRREMARMLAKGVSTALQFATSRL